MKLELIGGSAAGYSAHGEYQPGIDPALERCPFCGSEAIDITNTHSPHYTAQCSNCDAEGPAGLERLPAQMQKAIPGMPNRRMSKAAVEEIHRAAFKAGIDAWNERTIIVKDAQEIVDACNELARMFYAAGGYEVDEGYRFDQATHPQERGCWLQAAQAFDFIEGTEVDQALIELEDE